MIATIKRAIGPLVICLTAACSTAFASSNVTGLWYDHTGRGAVEITDCNGKLCGRLVWVKDPSHKEGCGFQIFGDVKPVAGGKWDGGWIIDPDKDPDKKYDVEITPQGDQKLKVMGYAGMKFLSETMIWTRANPDLKKCGSDVARAPDPAPAPGPAPAPDQKDPPRADDPAPAPGPARAPEEAKPAPKGDKSASSGKKKDCKFDIPYVNATITVPCD